MKTEIYHRWRVKNYLGKWITTRYDATEESIRRQHPEAEVVPGTRVERIVPDTPEELMAAMCASHGGGPSPDHK
ncbi:hypothetical protein [Delftia sp. UGAL515B_04]|uniref:hypothetical protein n=1 Tax=Delftia sp. UGAL515B_04 TaxID=2986766 RepID=UPI002953B69D|nr:hypothetical protein [Delftia sp. UGAL515B_04]WON88953.1 hypothetical protein OK021_30260 [Delftia sp. UGAL515B_04]